MNKDTIHPLNITVISCLEIKPNGKTNCFNPEITLQSTLLKSWMDFEEQKINFDMSKLSINFRLPGFGTLLRTKNVKY